MEELTVSLNQIKKIIQKVEEVGAEEVTFSFVIGSLFPEAYKHIKEKLVEERIAGYNEAKKSFNAEIISKIIYPWWNNESINENITFDEFIEEVINNENKGLNG